MKVNQNISAVISNAQLHRTEDKLTASIQRLSSGFKMNQAKDNPSGMAISNKMRAQIEALGQARRNAEDMVSVIQTADGALNETHAILQRMRELSVQAATDSLTEDDKQACQDEVEQLQEEIDRIARDTEFNGKRILDGSQDSRIFPNSGGEQVGSTVRNFQISDGVSPQNYAFTIDQYAEPAEMTVNINIPAVGSKSEIELNGNKITITDQDTQDTIYQKLQTVAYKEGMKVEMNGSQYKLTTDGYGSKEKIIYTAKTGNTTVSSVESGEDTKITLLKQGDAKLDANGNVITGPGAGVYVEGFTESATYTSDGTKVMIKDRDGFEMNFKVDPEQKISPAAAKTTVGLETPGLGTMTLQAGAHEHQTFEVRIPAVNCEALFITDLDLVRSGGADRAMAALDGAIAEVSGVRSRLGAYQNRLEHAVTSLEGTEENMEAAISRIMDTDMAEEMATYSNMNVLDQAGISVLTQANDMPQQILQLLQ